MPVPAHSSQNAGLFSQLALYYDELNGSGCVRRGGEARDKTPEELYQYFCAALDRALTDTASSIDPAAQREDLARMALDLALRSYAAQLACARLLDILQPPEEEHRAKGKR